MIIKKTRCQMCNRESKSLFPIVSNKKGNEGLKMVCRVCYDRLSQSKE